MEVHLLLSQRMSGATVIFPYMTKHFFPVPEAFSIPASCEVRVNAAGQNQVKDAASGVQLSASFLFGTRVVGAS
jgi:hypothetical protein